MAKNEAREDEDEERNDEREDEEEANAEREDKEEEWEDFNIDVKFVTNKEQTKVLYAEAGNDFTDAILAFLLFPLGTIVKFLNKDYGDKYPVIGSLSTLYNGLENLDSSHFLNEDAKSLLLNPKGPVSRYDWPILESGFTEKKNFLRHQ